MSAIQPAARPATVVAARRAPLPRALGALAALLLAVFAARTPAYEPSSAERVEIERLSTRYFEALEQAAYADAFALLTEDMQKQIGAGEWATLQQGNRAGVGALRERVQRGVTWYLDPPEAPAPGLYVAVDYDSVYDADTHQSEYLIWYRPRGATGFRLTRHEATVMRNVGAGAR